MAMTDHRPYFLSHKSNSSPSLMTILLVCVADKKYTGDHGRANLLSPWNEPLGDSHSVG